MMLSLTTYFQNKILTSVNKPTFFNKYDPILDGKATTQYYLRTNTLSLGRNPLLTSCF